MKIYSGKPHPDLRLKLEQWRSKAVLIALLAGFVALSGRAFYLQSLNTTFLQGKGDEPAQRPQHPGDTDPECGPPCGHDAGRFPVRPEGEKQISVRNRAAQSEITGSTVSALIIGKKSDGKWVLESLFKLARIDVFEIELNVEEVEFHGGSLGMGRESATKSLAESAGPGMICTPRKPPEE